MGHGYAMNEQRAAERSVNEERMRGLRAAAAGVAIENARLFEESHRRAEWLEACADMARELPAPFEQAEETCLDLVARRALAVSGAALVIIGYPDDDSLYCLAAAGGGAETLLGRTIVMRRGALAEVQATGLSSVEPTLPLLSPDRQLRDFGATLVAALGPIGDGQGVILLCRRTGTGSFSATDLEMSAVYGVQVALALELATAHRMREEQAVLGDRDRIARDLHDLVIQRLFAAGLSVQSLRRFTSDPIALERINSVTTELDETIRELRDTIYSLRGMRQTTGTLSSRILAVIKEAADALPFAPRIRLSGPIDAPEMTEDVRGNLLAVLSEGLSNAGRHAGATAIDISVSAAAGQVKIVIADNGRGFSELVRRSGLDNLRRRADLCGGRFSVTSAPGEGTRLRWSVPVAPRPVVPAALGGRPTRSSR